MHFTITKKFPLIINGSSSEWFFRFNAGRRAWWAPLAGRKREKSLSTPFPSDQKMLCVCYDPPPAPFSFPSLLCISQQDPLELSNVLSTRGGSCMLAVRSPAYLHGIGVRVLCCAVLLMKTDIPFCAFVLVVLWLIFFSFIFFPTLSCTTSSFASC